MVNFFENDQFWKRFYSSIIKYNHMHWIIWNSFDQIGTFCTHLHVFITSSSLFINHSSWLFVNCSEYLRNMYVRVHSGVGIEEKSIFETYIAMLRKFRNLGWKFWKKMFNPKSNIFIEVYWTYFINWDRSKYPCWD